MSDKVNLTVDGTAVSVRPAPLFCRLAKKPALKFRAFVITNAYPWRAIVACVWWKSKKRPSRLLVVPCLWRPIWWSARNQTV